MPRSRLALLDSVSAHGQEDRLTEVFATVLDSCDELTAALFETVGLPVGERFQVFTQVRVSGGERPDMLVHSLTRGGAEVSHIWSEHKVGSGFGDMQRERYLAAMRALPGEGELIFIVRDAPTSREAGDWRGFTWQEIGELAESVGRAWGERDWREKATLPDTSSKWRLLYELLWYLENKENLAVVQALDSENVLAYKLMDATWQAVEALLERAAQNAGDLHPSGSLGDDGATMWQQFASPPTGWMHRLEGFGCAAELAVSDRDYWSPDELDEPAFAAGYSIDGKAHPVLSAKREWVRELDQAGFCCELWADHVCIYRTLPMRDVLAFGDTLNAQGQQLGAWVHQAIADLGQLDPGELDLPDPRGGGSEDG
jgi:hypothetical protein